MANRMRRMVYTTLAVFCLLLLAEAGAFARGSFLDPHVSEQFSDQRRARIPEANQRASVAIYVDEPLTAEEIARYRKLGVYIREDLYIPAFGKHERGFYLASIRPTAIDGLRRDGRVKGLGSTGRLYAPTNDVARNVTRVNNLQRRDGGPNFTGAGVTVAVADSGFDLAHPDFPTPLATWDFSSDEESVLTERDGHGTHVAGTAIGRGTASGGFFRGVASGANFLAFKIGNDTDGMAREEDIIESVMAAVEAEADVYTISYAGWTTYKDGSSPLCQTFDYAVTEGVVCVASAGNSADKQRHRTVEVGPGGTSEPFDAWLFPNVDTIRFTTPSPFQLNWVDNATTNTNIILTCDNFSDGEFMDTSDTEEHLGTSPRGIAARNVSLVPNQEAGLSKVYNLRVTNLEAIETTKTVHVYLLGNGFFIDADSAATIEAPALADNVIAVGAWVHREKYLDFQGIERLNGNKFEDVAAFSSRGPRVDGRLKPDVLAPGSQTISTRSSNVTNTALWVDDDGFNLDGSGPANYSVNSGTSMSAPHVAGIAAVILEAYPGSGSLRIRDAILQSGSQADKPDMVSGYGMVNAEIALEVLGQTAREGWMMW